jgi:hypothetical protein
MSEYCEFYAGNSYCIAVDHVHPVDIGSKPRLVAIKLATGEWVAEWTISRVLNHSPFIAAHSKNHLVAIITECLAGVQFLKIVVPD